MTVNVSDDDTPAEMAKWMQGQKAAATAMLMDADGKVGKAYGARTTPHMYIVNKAGTLVYAGGIDDKPTPNPADVASADLALYEAKNAGRNCTREFRPVPLGLTAATGLASLSRCGT